MDGTERIYSAARQYLLENVMPGEDPSALDPATELLAGGYLDSLGVLRLAGFLEAEFGVALAGDDLALESFETLQQIATTVQRKLAVRAQR